MKFLNRVYLILLMFFSSFSNVQAKTILLADYPEIATSMIQQTQKLSETNQTIAKNLPMSFFYTFYINLPQAVKDQNYSYIEYLYAHKTSPASLAAFVSTGKLSIVSQALLRTLVGYVKDYTSNNFLNTSTDKLMGAFMGLPTGDALGMPIQFKPAGTFPKTTDMIDSLYTYGQIHPQVPPAGHWTDDTSMEICIADSFINKNTFDPKDIATRFGRWRNNNENSSMPYAFDIGQGTRDAIANFTTTGKIKGSNSWGNGSIIRLVPGVIAYNNDYDSALKYAREQSKITHNHNDAIESSALLAHYIYQAFQGKSKQDILKPFAFTTTNQKVKDISSSQGTFNWKNKKRDDFVNIPKFNESATGALEQALWCIDQTNSFEEALTLAVNMGYDTDSVGAVVGQLAGAIYGYSSIPERWTSKLYQQDMLIKKAGDLIDLAYAGKFKNTLVVSVDEDPAPILPINNKKSSIVVSGDLFSKPADAIVNASNPQLQVVGSGGISGFIDKKAFPDSAKLQQELDSNPIVGPNNTRCNVGHSVITDSYGSLKTNYKKIIHAVGPVYSSYTPAEAKKLLISTYESAIDLANSNGLKSIVFPLISAGIFGYPLQDAYNVAVSTIQKMKNKYPAMDIKLVLLPKDYQILTTP